MVIATKVYFNEGKPSRITILREIDSSLKRLGTDYVDLYIIHRFDYDTPIEESMETLGSLVSLAWLFAKRVTAPIIGATKAKHFDDAVGAIDLKLTGEDIAYLEELYVPHKISGVL